MVIFSPIFAIKAIILFSTVLYFLIMIGIIYQLYTVSDNLEDAGMELNSSHLTNAGRNLLYIAVILIITLLINGFLLIIYYNQLLNIYQ